MKYAAPERNHVILPGREQAFHTFINQTYKGMRHKKKNSISSNSEDALTWSCFDLIANYPGLDKLKVLDEMLEDSFFGQSPLVLKEKDLKNEEIEIFVGKNYTGASTGESTEVDASIEAPGILVFIEAKLYSAVSPAAPPEKPHDQIAKKLRVGLDCVASDDREFYFIFLDTAPLKEMYENKKKEEVTKGTSSAYKDKWRSAWLFKYYKEGRNGSLRPLREALKGIDSPEVKVISKQMGWLTWADLFKCTLRAVVSSTLQDT